MVLSRIGNVSRIFLLVRYVDSERGHACLHDTNGMLKGSCIGYHVPATRQRDLFYAKLEREREEN